MGAKKASTWAAVTAAAEFMRTSGAYSDGTSPSDARYLPGHSAGRLTAFLTDPKQIVGNDEQYAATFALVANQLGMPARVVLGAVVPEGGTVRGQDVHAWVEVHDASGEWLAVPSTVFMPDRSKRPDINPLRRSPTRARRTSRRRTRPAHLEPSTHSSRPTHRRCGSPRPLRRRGSSCPSGW